MGACGTLLIVQALSHPYSADGHPELRMQAPTTTQGPVEAMADDGRLVIAPNRVAMRIAVDMFRAAAGRRRGRCDVVARSPATVALRVRARPPTGCGRKAAADPEG
eukprot:5268431-Prymnesium_polylepis.1